MNHATLSLHEITPADPDYDFVENLLHSAFPEEERRPDAAQRHNSLHNDAFHTLLATCGGKPCGLLAYWGFGSFRYVEHFAVDSSSRNGGIGARLLQTFMAASPLPVVLEVEPENLSETAARRIGFYRRNGFNLWSTPYLQPPYRNGGETLVLSLMATGGLDETTDFHLVKNTIHRNVYGKTNQGQNGD